MWTLALKSVLAKKLRLFSTALSVLLGVAFLSGTLVLTDTLQRSFDDLFADVFSETDSYVRSSVSLDLGFGETQRGRISDELVGRVRDVEGVGDAQAVVQGYAQLVGSDGDPIGNPARGAPTFAMTFVSGALSPWQLTPGSSAPGAGEVVVDKASADKGDLAIGDSVTLLTQTGPHDLLLVGTVMFGTVDSPGGASVSLLALADSQQLLLGEPGEVDAIMVDAAGGVDDATLTNRISAVLPDGIEALTGSQITEETQSTMRDAMGFFSTFLLVFAAIGLVVACFTIYNTFQIVVTQRTREMALLRSIGATRAQVLWAQLVEAVLVGVVASAAGLAAGVGVARLLQGMLVALGIDLPGGGTVFAARTAVVALVVGTVVTTVAAVFPSLRASRTPPPFVSWRSTRLVGSPAAWSAAPLSASSVSSPMPSGSRAGESSGSASAPSPRSSAYSYSGRSSLAPSAAYSAPRSRPSPVWPVRSPARTRCATRSAQRAPVER